MGVPTQEEIRCLFEGGRPVRLICGLLSGGGGDLFCDPLLECGKEREGWLLPRCFLELVGQPQVLPEHNLGWGVLFILPGGSSQGEGVHPTGGLGSSQCVLQPPMKPFTQAV